MFRLKVKEMDKQRTFFQQLCHALGKNNDASYAVVAVATAKGIFRPMFTMMDKHQDHETKKYTAMREGLTEAIAIPCYLSVAWMAKNVIAPEICKGMPAEKVSKAAKTLSFLGVCLAALIVIPATCSLLITPIMDFIGKTQHSHHKNQLDIKENSAPTQMPYQQLTQTNITSPLAKTYADFLPMTYNSGLKIGGGK